VHLTPFLLPAPNRRSNRQGCPAQQPSVASTSTSASSARAGIKIIDLALRAIKRVNGVEYILCSSAIEVKGIFDKVVTLAHPPERRRQITSGMRKKALKGVSQSLAYVIGSYQTVGTFLGMAIIGSRFMRILVSDPTTLVLELDDEEGTLSGIIRATDLVSHPDLLNLIPNSLLGPINPQSDKMILPMESVRRLWDFHELSWRVMADIVVDKEGRLVRLPPAPPQFVVALAELDVKVDVGEDAVIHAARRGRLPEDDEEDEDEEGGQPDGAGGGKDDDPTANFVPDDGEEEVESAERSGRIDGVLRAGCRPTRRAGKQLPS